MFGFFIFLEFVVMLLLVALVLLQKSSDFGIISMADSMKFNSTFVVNIATKVTKILIAVFIINTIVIAKLGKMKYTQKPIEVNVNKS